MGNYYKISRRVKKYFLPIGFMLVFMVLGAVSYGQTSHKEIERRIEAMFREKKAETLRPVLSKSFSIGAYNMPSAMHMLNTLSKNFDYEQVHLKKTRSRDGRLGLQVTFSKKDKKDATGFMALDDSGKIVYIDLFDKLYGMDRYAHSKLVAEIPFLTDHNGSVILQVKLNKSDRVLNLLFDTGADGMALAKGLADSLGIKAEESRNTSVVGGNRKINVSRGNKVHLGNFELAHQSIAIFDKIDSYDGIIGNTLAKLYITEVNYDTKMLRLYNFGDFNLEDHRGQDARMVDVTLPASIIMIPGQVQITAAKMYRGEFVFDLGAAYSLICFRPFVKHNRLLVDGFKPTYMSSTTSLGMSTPTFTGPAVSFQFGDMPKINDLSVTLMSGGGQSESWNPGFDGSIGTRLISKYNFIIDLQAKKILFRPNKSFHYPKDFVRSDMLFGFAPDGTLHFMHYAGISKTKKGLDQGVSVLRINGVPADKLRDQPGALADLLKIPTDQTWKLDYQQEGTLKSTDI